jgi:hypothetical protein
MKWEKLDFRVLLEVSEGQLERFLDEMQRIH